jgi:hypothetical protein
MIDDISPTGALRAPEQLQKPVNHSSTKIDWILARKQARW